MSDAPVRASSRRAALRLMALCAASLHLELALIRFTSAQVLYLGYFASFVLLTAFVGLSVGLLSAKRDVDLSPLFPPLLVFLVAIVLVGRFDAGMLRDWNGLFFFGNVRGEGGLPGVVQLGVLFVTIATIFACIGQSIGRAFTPFSRLRGYTLDITGSLGGIALFSLQAASWSTPVTWLATACALLVVAALLDDDGTQVLRTRRAAGVALGGAGACLLLLAPFEGGTTIWSTYQQLHYESADTPPGGRPPAAAIWANGVLHQFLHRAEDVESIYYGAVHDRLDRAHVPRDEVLIIGAGSGTDVAVALAHGAKHVDAVEIDAGILEIGRAFHPDHPYADARVTAHVDDGRAFLRNAGRYDVIVFALPDSLVLPSGLGDVRLESYLFTRECFAEVQRRLKPGGAFVLYNQYRWPWLAARVAALAEDAFGKAPLRIDVDDTTVFLVGDALPAGPPTGNELVLPSDDWPHLYMERPALHWLFIGMIAVFLSFTVVGVGALAPTGTLRKPAPAFFFMGAAFLLLETRSITSFALLFGTTWVTTSLAFTGVLLSVLAANLAMERAGSRLAGARARNVLAALLVAAIGVAWLVPPAALLSIGAAVPRAIVAVVLTFLPVFIANLLFSRELKGADETARALGWNMMGAVLGGGLEYLGLLVGQRHLLLVAAALYLGAAMTAARTPPAAP